MKVKNKKTGEVFIATYDKNRLGNLQMWVNGKFYTDKKFNKVFSIINQ